MKGVAIGSAVLGAFAAGAYAGANNDKIRQFATRTGRQLKATARNARRAASRTVADVRDRVADAQDRAMNARDRMTGSRQRSMAMR